jgi:hypothetical protein
VTLPDDVLRGIADHMRPHLQDAYNCMSNILGCDVEVTLVVMRKDDTTTPPQRRCLVLSTGEAVQEYLTAAIASINAPTVAMLDAEGTVYRGKQ